MTSSTFFADNGVVWHCIFFNGKYYAYSQQHNDNKRNIRVEIAKAAFREVS